MKRTGLAGLLFLSLAVPVAHADVNVRVEGATATLVDTTVASTGAAVTKSGATCAGDSAAGALDRATGGDFEADNFGGSLFVSSIKGETVTYEFGSNQRFWAFNHTNQFSQAGMCEYTPPNGDELLFYPRCDGTPSAGCFEGAVLDLTAPATATTGVPFSVTVREYTDEGVGSPVSGASVGGTTTGADGTAQITAAKAGPVALVATKGKQVRDSATVTVSDPPVYSVPDGPTGTPTVIPTVAPDTAAPFSTIRDIKEKQVFRKRRKAPRTLKATITDDSSLEAVRLSITRRRGKKCRAFNDRRGRFVKVRCGRHPRFDIGTDKTVSFLLPKRLGKGRYVFDVVSTDVAGNQEQLARGRNRVVFKVR